MDNYKDLLFLGEKGPIVFGLTGFTGSGSSTAKKVLTSDNKLVLPQYDSVSTTNTTNNDKRVYEKLTRTWKKLGWNRFVSIEVSKIIFSFIIQRAISTEIENDHFKIIREITKDKIKQEDIDSFIDACCQDKKVIFDTYNNIKLFYNEFKKKVKRSDFTTLLQDSGDEIRRYGCVFPESNKEIIPDKIFEIPKLIKSIIDAFTDQGFKYFAIDSIKNPYEVIFFRKRFSDFFLIGIMRDFQERKYYLRDTFDKESFDKLEEREKGNSIKRNKENVGEWVTSQDVNECLRQADMFISNLESKEVYQHLKFSLIKLIILVLRPGCVTPTQDERCMQLAMTIRLASGCISRQVGAIILDKDRRIIGVGWNDPPKTQIPCSLRTCGELINGPDKKVFSEFERSSVFVEHISKIKTEDNPFCFRTELAEIENKKKAEFTRALHAEENAFFQASRNSSESLEGSTLYTTSSPCTICAKKAYQLGVQRIVYIDEYYDIAIQQTLKAGSMEISIDRFTGIIGSAYSKLYMSPLPEKSIITFYE